MSYLLDKKTQQKKLLKITLCVVIFLILVYFQTSVFYGLSYAMHTIFRPILVAGNYVGEKFSSWNYLLKFKKSLETENENLKSQLNETNAILSNYNSVLDDNTKMKEILSRKNEKVNMILATILAKPNQSLYDTLLIDIGTKQGIVFGARVFAQGNMPIGYVDEVYGSSSKVVLFSNWGEKTQAIITGKNTYIEVVGRGGGNFDMILPRDFVLDKGTEVIFPGITPRVLGIVQTIISDPRDSFQKALLVSPVNIQDLKFVEVEK